MSANQTPWPGAVDTRLAGPNWAGQMARWLAADATHGGFAFSGSGNQRKVYSPLATASVAGALAAADYTALQLLANPVRARVYRTTNQAIASGVVTAISFGATRVNTAGAAGGADPWQGGTPTRLTAPVAGWYAIGGAFILANTAGGTLRQGPIRLNGATDLIYDGTPNPAAVYLPLLGAATVYQLAAGDYVELMANHDAGVAVNVLAAGDYSPEFWFVRLCA